MFGKMVPHAGESLHTALETSQVFLESRYLLLRATCGVRLGLQSLYLHGRVSHGLLILVLPVPVLGPGHFNLMEVFLPFSESVPVLGNSQLAHFILEDQVSDLGLYLRDVVFPKLLNGVDAKLQVLSPAVFSLIGALENQMFIDEVPQRLGPLHGQLHGFPSLSGLRTVERRPNQIYGGNNQIRVGPGSVAAGQRSDARGSSECWEVVTVERAS